MNARVKDWLPQVIIESVLIVVSILVALALDNWREEQQDEDLVRQSLANFLIEINQNKARVDDAAPFNRGLRNVLNNNYVRDEIASVGDFVVMVESYTPATLQATAWDTALATGSLAKMEYGLVTALSLTYNLQRRYDIATRSDFSALTHPQNLVADNLKLAVYNSVRYLDDVTTMEAELAVTYSEAALVVRSALRAMGQNDDTTAEVSETDLAHP